MDVHLDENRWQRSMADRGERTKEETARKAINVREG